MPVGAHDGTVYHQPFKIGFAGRNRKHFIESTHLGPAAIASFNRAIVTQTLRQVAPTSAERAIHNSASRKSRLLVRDRDGLWSRQAQEL